MEEQKQAIVAALPAEGEVKYDALRQALVVQGKEAALEQFHRMRRAGELKTRLETIDGELVLFVARA